MLIFESEVNYRCCKTLKKLQIWKKIGGEISLKFLLMISFIFMYVSPGNEQISTFVTFILIYFSYKNNKSHMWHFLLQLGNNKALHISSVIFVLALGQTWTFRKPNLEPRFALLKPNLEPPHKANQTCNSITT